MTCATDAAERSIPSRNVRRCIGLAVGRRRRAQRRSGAARRSSIARGSLRLGAARCCSRAYGICVAILPRADVEGSHDRARAARQLGAVRFPASPAAAVVYEWIYARATTAQLARLFPPGNFRGSIRASIVIAGQGTREPRRAERAGAVHDRALGGRRDRSRVRAARAAYALVASTPMPGWDVSVDGQRSAWAHRGRASPRRRDRGRAVIACMALSRRPACSLGADPRRARHRSRSSRYARARRNTIVGEPL